MVRSNRRLFARFRDTLPEAKKPTRSGCRSGGTGRRRSRPAAGLLHLDRLAAAPDAHRHSENNFPTPSCSPSRAWSSPPSSASCSPPNLSRSKVSNYRITSPCWAPGTLKLATLWPSRRRPVACGRRPSATPKLHKRRLSRRSSHPHENPSSSVTETQPKPSPATGVADAVASPDVPSPSSSRAPAGGSSTGRSFATTATCSCSSPGGTSRSSTPKARSASVGPSSSRCSR